MGTRERRRHRTKITFFRPAPINNRKTHTKGNFYEPFVCSTHSNSLSPFLLSLYFHISRRLVRLFALTLSLAQVHTAKWRTSRKTFPNTLFCVWLCRPESDVSVFKALFFSLKCHFPSEKVKSFQLKKKRIDRRQDDPQTIVCVFTIIMFCFKSSHTQTNERTF